MAHPDHDQVIGRLIGARLRGPAERWPGRAGAVEAHPDAEMWAAYVDGGLRPDEVSNLETHLAACAACRRLVVALAPDVSTTVAPAARGAEPVADRATVIPFPRRQMIVWMGMAAGLFGAVTLWSVSRLGGDTPVMVAVSAPPRADASAPVAAAPPAPGPVAPPDGSAAVRSVAPGDVDRLTMDAAGGPLPVPAPPPAEDKRADASAPAVTVAAPEAIADTRQIQLQTNTVAAGAARPRGPLAAPVNQQQNAAASAPAPATAPAAPALAEAGATDARERRDNEHQIGQLTEVVVTAEASGARPEAAKPARAQAGADRSRTAGSKDEAAKTLAFRAAASAALPSFAEPGGRLRWRIADGRRLESSSDGGTTWAGRYTVARGERLLAGTAPAIDNAWAVGEGGLVLRLVVPGGWTAVERPAPATLIAVSATGPQAARVTAADGRVFDTADGGATWTPAVVGPQ